MKKIKIGDKAVGEGEPTFIIAEAGINHDGKPEQAKDLIRKAAEIGADAIKFQIFTTEELASKQSSYHKLFKSLELGKDKWVELAGLSERLGLIFFASSFGKESADLSQELGMPVFKVASGDLTYLSFLEYLAKKDKPIILSTGMGTIAEVDEALNVIYGAGNKEVILLHCVSNYPADEKDTNLRAIETLKQVFQVPVGLSDHTEGISIPAAAVALGAKVIEKHFTLDKNLPGPDHKCSLTPDQFKQMIKTIRAVELALGNAVKVPSKSEKEVRDAARRSIIAKVDIAEGSILREEMLKVVRPGTGIPPKYIGLIIGRKAKKDISAEEVLTWDKIG